MVMAKRKRKDENLAKILTFFIRFNLFAIPLYVVMLTGFSLPALMHLTQGLALAVLHVIGVPVSESGQFLVVPVSGGSFAATVSWDSTGWKSILALLALILASDFALEKKLKGLLLLPVIYALNVLRIVFIFYAVHSWGVEYFAVLHETLWSLGMIIAVLALWILWVRRVT